MIKLEIEHLKNFGGKMKTIKYEDIIKEKNYILIDVRSPLEFEREGIPGAINIPILLDEERVKVGTTYKQISPEQAKILGIEYISKRLPSIFEKINLISKQHKKIIFYCARGGMRSGTVTALFSAMGYKAIKLENGYRGYREYILSEIPKLNETIKYIVIHGKTGVGKTKILNQLEKKGFIVLDLEKIADHKGSFFGGLCEKQSQSQKRFESLIYNFLSQNKPKYLIVESESKRIGDVYIPESIYSSMLKGVHILIETSIETRIKVVMEDYTNTCKEEIEKCIEKLGRYTTKPYVEDLLKLNNEEKFEEISKKLMLDYYDALYQKSIDKYEYLDYIYYETIEEGTDKISEKLQDKLQIFPEK